MFHEEPDHSILGLVVLEEIHKLFEHDGTWGQNHFAVNRKGKTVSVWDKDAYCFCLTGGFERAGLNVGAAGHDYWGHNVIWGDGMREADKALNMSLEYECRNRSIINKVGKVSWNDEIRRTQRSIQRLVTRAIKIFKTQYDEIKEGVNYVQVR